MAIADKIEGYTLPQGALSQLMREIAAGPARPSDQDRPAYLRRSAPRRRPAEPCAPEGARRADRFRGEEYLFFKPFHVDVCFLRGTTADEDGNVTMEQEAVFVEMLSKAQATGAAAVS